MSTGVGGLLALPVTAQPPPAEAPKAAAPEGQPAPQPPPEDGPIYEVSAFKFRYREEHPDRPPIEDLIKAQVTLGQIGDVLVAPREGIPTITLAVEDLSSTQRATRRYSVTALNTISQVIVQELNNRGIIGVLVAPDPEQVDPDTLEDRRPAGRGADRTLSMDVWTRKIRQIRTLGAGARWTRSSPGEGVPGMENRIDNPAHDRVLIDSPLHPGDLLRKDVLDNYLYRLDRSSGRRVDAAISATNEPGEVYLDYIVTENRPWSAYVQVSNTGTKSTSEWRERAGFVHNSITGHDDVLSLDFVTSSFDQSNAVIGSYELPLGASRRLRAKGYGSWSDFKASDVGAANEKFDGDSWTLGAELSYNIWQDRQAFIDVFAGARYEHVRVNNQVTLLEGSTEFAIPYLGARYERATEQATSAAEVRFETSVPGLAGTDDTEVQHLGRLIVDKDWMVLKWNLEHSFYLEPLLFPDAGANPNAPVYQTALAHEIALSLKGQYGFGNRLIPQEEETVGGLYTVRGYPESAVAGDNAVIFSAEYRFHLPRSFAIQEDPSQTPLFGKPFRWAPDQRYGHADWDLIFRGFVDVGRATNSDKQPSEKDETLVGAGVGVELLFRRNFNLRVDWGFALRDAGDAKSGDNRLHLVGTILF